MKPSSAMKEEMMRLYIREPTGWYVFLGRDLKGYQDTIIIHGDDIWFLKEEHVNPYETIGFGLKERVEGITGTKALCSYGFRPVPEKLARKIVNSNGSEEDLETIIASVLAKDPVPLHRLEGKAALQGPIVYSPKTMDIIPERQQELDLKLRRELDMLISRRHPHLKTIYY